MIYCFRSSIFFTIDSFKVEKIEEDSLDSTSSSLVEIQIIGWKVLKTKSLLTSSSNVMPSRLKQTFSPITWIHWRWRWWDRIQATFKNLFFFQEILTYWRSCGFWRFCSQNLCRFIHFPPIWIETNLCLGTWNLKKQTILSKQVKNKLDKSNSITILFPLKKWYKNEPALKVQTRLRSLSVYKAAH